MDSKSTTLTATMASNIATVEKLLNYTFKNPTLVAEALTHASHPSSLPSYQRLEYLGDAALSLAISNHLFLTNPLAGPDRLSSLRSANISTEKLARLAVRLGLYSLLLRDAPHLDSVVHHFSLHHSPLEPFGGTTVKAPKVLADVVEAIIGAVYVDCGFDLQRMWVVVRRILEPFVTEENFQDQPVSMLHEFCQKNGRGLEFKTWDKGEVSVVNVFVDGTLVGVGSSEHKCIARLNAARDALPKLWAEAEGERNGEGEYEKEGKKVLNELCSKNRWPKPIYSIVAEDGPAHEKKFKCSVEVGLPHNTVVASGDFKPRLRDAENAAAHKMLVWLSIDNGTSSITFC